jgi:protein-S-isoprenylcysteine O-methyltransferase Ste14
METPRTSWWRGARGEWFVVAQALLCALVVLGPRTWHDLPTWPFPFARACGVVGACLLFLGGAVFVSGVVRLGPALTPLPFPKDGGTLVRAGPYRFVRHPIYAAVLASALGWALLVQGWLTLAYVVLLFLFFDVKARKEEKWLVARYPEYASYQCRVRKLIPFIY